jgi:hypothetical protein
LGTRTEDEVIDTNTSAMMIMGKDALGKSKILNSDPAKDPAGRIALNSIFGDQIVVQRVPDIQEQFHYNVNTKTLDTTTVGAGAAAIQEDSMLHVNTGTTTTGEVMVATKHSIHYHPGYEGWALFTALWNDGGIAGAVQYIGPFSSDDGYFIGYDGTDFVVGRRKETVDTKILSSAFNGDPTFIGEFDNTKLNIFRISYGWLGTATISFEWKSPDGWKVIHQMKQENQDTEPNTSNPQLPICIHVKKSSGATNISMHSGSWGGGVSGPIGEDQHVGDRYFTGVASKAAVSTEAVIVNFQNVSSFQSKTNRVVAEGVRLGTAVDGTKSAIIKIYKNLTITSPTWADVDATNSIMQTDTVGTVTPSDANLLWAYPLSKAGSVLDDIRNIDFEILPGETLTVTAQSAAATDVEFSARWRERF